MPKLNPDYPERIDTHVSKEMRRQVVAISYHMGHRGNMSKAVRRLLKIGVQCYLNSLSQREKADYRKIIKNFLIHEGEIES